jgi:hypothetical protein
MASVIAVAGSKGGSGKSTCAHLLGHGAGSLPRMIQCVVITTDPEEVPRIDARRYVVVDGRTEAKLADELERWLDVERLLVVIDGSAARGDLDAIVQNIADITIVPFKPGQQDAERAVANLARLDKAVALPMAWSKHPGTARRDKAFLRMMPEGRVMPPFPAIPRLGHLLSETGYTEAAYDLAQPARSLLLEVLAQGRVDPDDLAMLRGEAA